MVQVPLKDYSYANTRVRAMTSRLLDEHTFGELLSAPDYNQTLGVLEDTAYGPDIEEIVLEGVRPTNVDRAFNRNLERNFEKIKSFIMGRPRELIDVLLSRWDLYDLKTVLRGMRALVPKAEINRNLVPIGFLDLTVLEEITSQPDLRAALDAIVMFSLQWEIRYGQAITGIMTDFLREHDLSVIELALDRFHYQRVSEIARGGDANSRLVRHVVEMEVDIINIVTLLRICGLGIDESRKASFYIPGGSIDEDDFYRAMQLGQIDDVVDLLAKKTPYREPLERAKATYEEKGEAVFQDELDKYMIRECLNISQDPLGIGIIIKYMWKKYLEVTNLRIIIRGKSIGLIESQIRKELMLMEDRMAESK